MTNPYEMFENNKDLEAGKGIVIDYGGFEITVHRAGGANKKLQKVYTNKYKPHIRKAEQGILDDEITNRILIESFAEAVVVGWKNVKDKDGNLMDFSVENCIKLFTDLPDLFEDIVVQTKDVSNFKKEMEEIEAKN